MPDGLNGRNILEALVQKEDLTKLQKGGLMMLVFLASVAIPCSPQFPPHSLIK